MTLHNRQLGYGMRLTTRRYFRGDGGPASDELRIKIHSTLVFFWPESFSPLPPSWVHVRS